MHGITKFDKILGIERFWHGLNEIFEEISVDLAKKKVGFPIREVQPEIEGIPAVEHILQKGDLVERPLIARVCGETGLVLSIGKETYEVLPNSDVLDWAKPLIYEYGFKIASVGTIFARKRFFLTLEAEKGSFETRPGDKTITRLNFLNGHDGMTSTRAFTSGIRVVCANTWRFALEEHEEHAETSFAGKHTKGLPNNLQAYQARLMQFYSARDTVDAILQDFLSQPMSSNDAEKIIVGFVGNGKHLSTRARNQSEKVHDLFANGIGNEGNSLLDVFNAFTEFYTHHASDNRDKMFVSSEFGTYGNKKEEAFKLFQSQEEIEKLHKKGEILLKA